MKLTYTLKALAALVLVFGVAIPRGFAAFDPIGEDIDIFLANPSFTAQRPNVLLMVDNTANWNQAFANEKSALVTVVKSVSTDFNLGLMLFNESGQPNNHGAYVRFGIRPMDGAKFGVNQPALMNIINNFDQLGDKGNNNEVSEMMYEAYAYWAGITANLGFGQAKRDYKGSTDNPAGSLQGNAFTGAGINAYTSPITDPCQKNFQIYISNGPASEDTQALADAQTKLAGLVEKNPPDTISITPNGQQGNWMDEYARYMANGDCSPPPNGLPGTQIVSTYVLEVDPGTSGQGPAMTALLRSVAVNGKGKYFAVSSANGGSEIVKALNQILGEVQSVNSVFAATSMPVSVNVRGTNVNQVYIGVFRPDPVKSPRWFGNLKLYNLTEDPSTKTVFLGDANGFAATNEATGFISNSALSFWTKPSSFWNFRAPFARTDVGQGSDSPDGDLVEKGGVAEQLRITFATSQTARKVYTCTGACTNGSALSATTFDTSNTAITPAILGAYKTYPVEIIQTPLGSTTATAKAPSPSGTFPFANGDSVTISGATPTLYDGTFTISGVTSSLPNSFQFTLPSTPNGNTGTVIATNHGLNTNNFVDVSGCSVAGYNVSDASIIKIDANTFTYGLSAAASAACTPLPTVFGKKLVQTLVAAGTAATATVPSHGYAAGNFITISGATNDSVFNGTFPITSVTTDTFKYTMSSSSSLAGTTAQATSVAHGFSSGQSVTISGATVLAYNGTFTITVLDGNTFTYALPSGQSVSAGGSVSATATVTINVTSITHPTTGNSTNQSTATVTTQPAHGYAAGDSVTITGAAQSAYNGPAIVASVVNTTQFTFIRAAVQTATQAPAPQTGITVSKTTTKPVATLSPAVTATGAILSGKTITPVTSVSVQTNATGQILAGRKSDPDAPQRDNIINWVRGQDNKEDENSDSKTTDIRASVHADILHSQPAVINYNRGGANGSNTGENDVIVFYGTNDGILHAVQGGGVPTASSPTPPANSGSELWGFVAPEFFGKLKRLRDNDPAIGTVSPAAPRDYFFDGPIGAYTVDVNSDGKLLASDGDKVQLFLGMRRGGRMIYAFDVSDPAAPKLMWKRGCPNLTDNVGCDSGFEELGQTWSQPTVGFLRAFSNPVVVFGGGYDPAVEDFQPCLITSMPPDASSPGGAPTSVTAQTGGSVTFTSNGSCTSVGTSATTVNRSMGRSVFIVDATNGNLLFRFGPDGAANLRVPDMQFAMPADVVILNRDGDNTRILPGRENIQPTLKGFVDRIYAVDTGGQVWRLDVDPAATGLWTATKLAATSGAVLSDKRKFLFPPDVVAASDANGNFDAVLIGSGDREHPFDATVANRYYMFKDRKFTDVDPATVSPLAPITEADLFDATSDCLQDAACSSAQKAQAQADLLNGKGWMIKLLSGEKTIGSSITVSGTTFFGTNQPSATAGGANCGSNLGIARIYEVNFKDATAVAELNATAGLTATDRSKTVAGGGYLPNPQYEITQIAKEDKQCVQFGPRCEDAGGIKFEARIRTYWFRKVE
ncbi:MAG TPA: hypothetical protein VEL80_03340 [Burkholderiales bacterium]|nr:hypothetical protein [Burkholderiales bacterium]